MRPRVGAIVPAAGKGERLGGRGEKGSFPLGGEPLLVWALRSLECCPGVHSLVVAVAAGLERGWEERLREEFKISKLWAVVPGGATRQDSVRRGFEALPEGLELVLIHDGARPLCTRGLVERVLACASEHGAAIAALPASDTVKEGDRELFVARTLPRESMWLAQTPQAFRTSIIAEAWRRAEARGLLFTDDAALVEELGHRVKIVPGEATNIKVTTPLDLVMAEALLRNREGGRGPGEDPCA